MDVPSHPRGGGSSSPFDPMEAALRADSELGPDFAVDSTAIALDAPRAVFLTGATGFLGAFLIHELLRQTEAEIHCLTRAATPTEGLVRIERAMRGYELLGELPLSRVHAVCGDLTRPGLGLSPADHARMAGAIDTIIHGGAEMNFYSSYEALKPANVDGTREVLRLAATGVAKRLHYISSSGVFDSRSYGGKIVRESDQPRQCTGSVTGYTQSKWVAENLAIAAGNRGLPVTVHRPPFIVGDSRTGVVNLENLIVKMMVGCIQGGFWPDEWWPVDIVPVDYVSRAVVRLLLEPASVGETYHYVPAHGLRVADIGRALRTNGYGIELLPYAEWRHELRRFARSRHNALRPLAPLFLKPSRRLAAPVPDAFMQPPRPIFDGSVTRERLSALGLGPPELNDALFSRYCAYFIRAGWVPRPVETRRDGEPATANPLPRTDA